MNPQIEIFKPLGVELDPIESLSIGPEDLYGISTFIPREDGLVVTNFSDYQSPSEEDFYLHLHCHNLATDFDDHRQILVKCPKLKRLVVRFYLGIDNSEMLYQQIFEAENLESIQNGEAFHLEINHAGDYTHSNPPVDPVQPT